MCIGDHGGRRGGSTVRLRRWRRSIGSTAAARQFSHERNDGVRGAAAHPSLPLLRQRRGTLGVRRGAQLPLPDRSVQHCVGWLPCAKPTPDGADDERGGPAPGSRLWSARQAAKSSMSLR